MISGIVLIVVGAFQVLFIAALLVVLSVAHRRSRGDEAEEDAIAAALRAPARALVLGGDEGESLAAALAGLSADVASRQLRSIAASQIAPEQMRHLAAHVRPAAWVELKLADATSTRWWKRMEAAHLLSVVMAPSDLPLLARLLSDANPAVVSAATGAIAGHANPALAGLIIRHLSERAPTVRQQQMRALRTCADVSTAILVDELEPETRPDQIRALVQLAEALGTPRALAAIVPHASHPDAEVRATVARALRCCSSAAAVDAARRSLTDTDWRVRAAAARALASLKAVATVGALEDALRDTSWWVRFRAALALGSFGAVGEDALAAAAISDDAYARDIAVVVRGLSESARVELSA